MLDHQLRPGKQHCQEGTAAFIRSCVQQLDALKLNGKSLFRLDSGNDAEENFPASGKTALSSNATYVSKSVSNGSP